MAEGVAGGLTATRESPAEPAAGSSTSALTLFTMLWALATLFHIWVNRRVGNVLSDPSAVALAQLSTAVLALALLARPKSIRWLVLLACSGAALAWFEAPFLGNHWLLAAIIDLGLVLAAVATRFDRGRFAAAALPVCRWSLLGFYSFAAFAKVNYAFLSPKVSCATYFFDELAAGFGVTTPLTVTSAGWARVVPMGVILIELSVPVLLLMRRTRHAGVVLGLTFHGLIAFDSTHAFQDFSALLVPLFLLFLPNGFAEWVRDRLTRTTRESVQAMVIVGSALLTAVVIADPGGQLERFVVLDGRAWGWAALFVASSGAVVAYLITIRPQPSRLTAAMRLSPGWLAVIPMLVMANGLTPYLEIKTAYSWNMYANLETVDGSSNHVLIRRTLPLTDFQDDLVRIVSTNDPGLFIYVASGYRVPFIELRAYLSEHPDASVQYERGGQLHDLAKASDDPALVNPVPSWEQRLFAFRAVDDQDPVRCQPVWYPAR